MATEAVLRALEATWQLLEAAKISAAVAGGLALAVWRHPRTTFDVDLLILADSKELANLTTLMKAAGFVRTGANPVDLGETELLQFRIEPPDTFVEVQIDLLVAKSPFARDAVVRSVALGKGALGFAIKVLSCEDLVILKLLAGRIIDLADVAALLRANAETIDDHRLDKLAELHNLGPTLEQVRLESK